MIFQHFQIFIDKEFNQLCDYHRYSDILQEHYIQLTSAEDSAKTIVNDVSSKKALQ